MGDRVIRHVQAIAPPEAVSATRDSLSAKALSTITLSPAKVRVSPVSWSVLPSPLILRQSFRRSAPRVSQALFTLLAVSWFLPGAIFSAYGEMPANSEVGKCTPAPAAASDATPLDAAQLTAVIDRALEAAWSRDGVTPAPPADDSEFLRRVYLDLIGKIPAVSELQEFLADRSADKRAPRRR